MPGNTRNETQEQKRGRGKGSLITHSRAEGAKAGLAYSAAATLRNSRIFSALLRPGATSTPEETSTALAPLARTASATFAAASPPPSSQGVAEGGPLSGGPPN